MITLKINVFSGWLLTLIFLVCSIILIGGYTRISDSGLSITEWLPVSGILYPFSETAWQTEFNKYKEIDEFKLINSAMTLTEFKFIYFWEWFHRDFARFIGVIYVIPFAYLLLRKKFETKYLLPILIIGFLLALQAFMGWYMVKSGLSERVDVSQYRLAMHLSLAFIILGLLFKTLIDYLADRKIIFVSKYIPIRSKLSFFLMILIFLQIAYGAFVSGTHSGLLYNTWPLYNGKLFVDINNDQIRGIVNLFENGELIIFFHRTSAFLILLFAFYINYDAYQKSVNYGNAILLISFDITLILQIILGILMTYQNIPWHLALAHQGNSIILYLLVISIWFINKKPPLNLKEALD